MVRIYLAHSAHERERGEKIKVIFESIGYEVYNPFDKEGNDKAFWKGREVIWDGTPTLRACNWIIWTDFDELRKSDILVCIYPEDLITYGITAENTFAFLVNMPVYSYVPKPVKGHPWLMGMSKGNIFTDLFELYDALDFNLSKTSRVSKSNGDKK